MKEIHEEPLEDAGRLPARSRAAAALAIAGRVAGALAVGDTGPLLALLFGVSMTEAHAFRRTQEPPTDARGTERGTNAKEAEGMRP